MSLSLSDVTILFLDDINDIEARHADSILISGSHGSLASGRTALKYTPRLIVFNDAGIGKDNAGIAALELLGSFRVAALTVSAMSARIGDAEDAWQSGIVSFLNDEAAALGVVAEQGLQLQLKKVFA